MNKLMEDAISSMNYFFLKETFSKINLVKDMFEEGELCRNHIKGYNLYGAHICELELFLNNLVECWDDNVENIIIQEIEEGDYIDDLSIEDIENKLNTSIEYICGYKNDKVLEKYLELSKKVKEFINEK